MIMYRTHKTGQVRVISETYPGYTNTYPLQDINDNIKIHDDNEGAIKMAKNDFSIRRTRHLDVKHYIACDAIETGIVCRTRAFGGTTRRHS